jgi:hypothetical protein
MSSEWPEQVVIETNVIDAPGLIQAFTGDGDERDLRPPLCRPEGSSAFIAHDPWTAHVDHGEVDLMESC